MLYQNLHADEDQTDAGRIPEPATVQAGALAKGSCKEREGEGRDEAPPPEVANNGLSSHRLFIERWWKAAHTIRTVVLKYVDTRPAVCAGVYSPMSTTE